MKHHCIAIVIGVNNYVHNPKLKNALNDAKAVAEVFSNLNYDVELLQDVTKSDFENTLDALLDKATDYTAVIFFFAGHGMRCNASDCIVFSDAADMKDNDGMRALVKSFRIEDLYKMIRAVCDAIVIAIIDACRTSMGEGIRGVGSTQFGKNTILPFQTFIAFSTSPDTAAKDGQAGNSPYTMALLDELSKENQTIEKTFKNTRKKLFHQVGDQLPWEHSCLVDDFCFNHGQLNPHYNSLYSISSFSRESIQQLRDEKLSGKSELFNLDKDGQAVGWLNELSKSLSDDELFILGRVLLREYSTNHRLSLSVLKWIATRTIVKGDNHILNGFLYSIYADDDDTYSGTVRLSTSVTDYIGKIVTDKQNKSSLKFIENELSHLADEIPYILNPEECRIELVLEKPSSFISFNNVYVLEDILIGDFVLSDISHKCLFTKRDICRFIQEEYNVPSSLMKIISSPKISDETILIPEEIHIDEILNDYFLGNCLDSLDSMGNHYEFSDIIDTDIIDIESTESLLIIRGKFDISAIIYLDSEEETRFDVDLPGSFELTVQRENDGWQIYEMDSISFDTESFYR